MYYVYILYSAVFNKTYVGFTANVEGRLSAHNHPQNKGYTKRFQPWAVIYHEAYHTKNEAVEREKWFKTGVGRKYIVEVLREKGLR